MTDQSSKFYFTKAGIVIPTVTGSISFLSSIIIMSFILRSRVNSTYHRIIFCLSFFDMLTSLSIALTTIPMPRDVVYPFAGPSYGNIATCEAQGMIYMIGNGMVFCMNGTLNIYYMCTLRYKIKEETFKRRLEPALFTTSFISVFLPTILSLQR